MGSQTSAKNIIGFGADQDFKDRPGIPMESSPMESGAPNAKPERQVARVRVFKRAGLENLTPVFGTAQPPRALSGLLRGLAYKIPEHEAGHWALLLLADRIDVLEGFVGDAYKRNPVVALGALGLAGLSLIAVVRHTQRRI